jgi:FkbM family methyltransferase
MIKKLVLLFLSLFDYFYQKKIIEFLKKNNLSEINLIFDVGAHKGESINLFLKNMKVKNIVSFEASPLNFKFLENNKKNLEKKFPDTKIIIENLALSSDGRVVTFKQFNESSSSTINNINQESRYFKRKFNLLNIQNKKNIYESFKLKTETLDNYMYQNNFNRISFLKIDTEGYEYEILIGLKKKIKSIDTIMFEHHYDNMIIKEYTFSDINYLLKKNDFCQVFKSRMPFRKSFEYIYRRNDID